MNAKSMLRTTAIDQLRAELAKIDPGITIGDHGGNVLSLQFANRWSILALTDDGYDLAPGSQHQLGLTAEQRIAIALTVGKWVERCRRVRKGWTWTNRPRGKADKGTAPGASPA